VAVLRVVVREGLSRDMATALVADVTEAFDALRASPPAAGVQAQPHKARKPKTKAPC
jgi:hypothetical protein